MITDEIGFNQVLENIFNINNMENEIFKDNFFKGSIKSPTITEDGYNKITEYLAIETNTLNMSIEMFMGILSTFAWGHPKEFHNQQIKNFVLKRKKWIISNLSTIKDMSNYVNKAEVQKVEYIINLEVSYELIDTLNIMCMHFGRNNIFKDRYFYGLEYLLKFTSIYCHKEFSEWFLTTTRLDLKAIYASIVLSNIFDSMPEEHEESNIAFIRVLSTLTHYNIGFAKGIAQSNKTIQDLDILNRESLYFVLYALKELYRNRILGTEIEEVNNKIENIKQYFKHFTLDIFKEFVGRVNNYVLCAILYKINNNTLKRELYENFLQYLTSKLKDTKNYNREDLVYDANVYANILMDINEKKYLKGIKLKFNNKISEIEEPYYIYRNPKNWDKGIDDLLYYLVILISCIAKGSEGLIQEYIAKFMNAKKDFLPNISIDIPSYIIEFKN